MRFERALRILRLVVYPRQMSSRILARLRRRRRRRGRAGAGRERGAAPATLEPFAKANFRTQAKGEDAATYLTLDREFRLSPFNRDLALRRNQRASPRLASSRLVLAIAIAFHVKSEERLTLPVAQTDALIARVFLFCPLVVHRQKFPP